MPSEGNAKSSIGIESSATPRGAVHRFTFPEQQDRSVKLFLSTPPDAFFGIELHTYKHKVVSDKRFEGCMETVNNGLGHAISHLCFVIEFNQPFTAYTSPDQPDSVFSFGSHGS